MDRLSATFEAFSGISYLKLAECTDQSPIVGRGDLYYGGTTYANSQGMGVTLALAASIPEVSPVQQEWLHPDENQWLAVPVTRLYDRGITVLTSGLLQQHIGEPSVILHPESARLLGIQPGDLLEVNGTQMCAVLDETVPASIVLVPRSMGLPIGMPVVAKLKKALAPVRASGTR
jgi:NADH-quinone oxidoreductase subunit G